MKNCNSDFLAISAPPSSWQHRASGGEVKVGAPGQTQQSRARPQERESTWQGHQTHSGCIGAIYHGWQLHSQCHLGLLPVHFSPHNDVFLSTCPLRLTSMKNCSGNIKVTVFFPPSIPFIWSLLRLTVKDMEMKQSEKWSFLTFGYKFENIQYLRI